MTIMAENNNGQFPHIEDVYKKSHWSEKKNDWISDECRIRYEKLEEIRQECENNGKIMSEEEISKVVLGARKCYIKGFGPGYRPSSYRGRTSTHSEDNVEVTSLKMALEEQKSQHENLKKEHENLKDFVHTVLGRVGLLQDGYGDGDGNDEEDGSEEDDSQEEDN